MVKSTSTTTKTKAATKTVAKVPARKKVVTRTAVRKVAPRSKSSNVSKFGKRTLRAILLSRTLHVLSKVAVVVIIAGGTFYGMYSFASNTFAGDVVISKSEIVARVGRLTTLPVGTPDAVVRVQDPETLRKQNIFYQDVKEGDYIIMYPRLAVIYSLRSDSIVSLKRTGN